MSRIPYPDPESLPAADREFLADLPQLNISRMLALSPSVFRPLTAVFSAYLNHGLLDPIIREIAIFRTGHLCNSEYEVTNHERVARILEMGEERIRALAPDGDREVFSPVEQLVLDFTDEVVKDGGASAQTFNALGQHLDAPQLMELTVVIGVYVLVSQVCATFGIEPEEVPIANTGLEEIQRTVEKHR
jgi:alkylhydroperoxidase family enzyme